MIELNKLDLKILAHLDQNARISLSQLAKQLRIGRDQLDYRFHRLVDAKVIRQFSAAINPMSIGLSVFKVHVRLGGVHSDPAQMIKKLAKRNSVYWIAHCVGNWDLIFSIAANSPREFFDIYHSILAEYGSSILSSEVSTLIDVQLFRRGYLHKEVPPLTIHYGARSTNSHLTSLDWEIIGILIGNARTAVTDIARELGVSSATIDYHISKLEREQIILGYRCIYDLELIHRQTFKAQVYYAEFDPHTERELIQFCTQHPEIVYFSQQIGSWQVEFEVETKGYSEYMELINFIRRKFPRLIRSISTNMITFATVKWRPELSP